MLLGGASSGGLAEVLGPRGNARGTKKECNSAFAQRELQK